MSDPELIRLIDANLLEFGRYMARVSAGAQGGDPDGVSVTSAGGPDDVVHPVAGPGAASFLEAQRRGHAMWTRSHADGAIEAVLPTAGFSLVIDLPLMVLDKRPPDRPAPAGAIVRRVVDLGGFADFRTADLAGFADHEEDRAAIESMFADPGSLLDPAAAGVVAYLDRQPVAAATSFTALGVTRVGWVGTVPAHRRRGLGTAITRAAVLAGFDLGARLAVLESSPSGMAVYRAMGFREVSRYRGWVAEPA